MLHETAFGNKIGTYVLVKPMFHRTDVPFLKHWYNLSYQLMLITLVEMKRIELFTPCLQGRCSPK